MLQCVVRERVADTGVITVKVSYKRLWKLLIDLDMTKAQLQEKSGLSSGTMTKLRQSESVSMEALWKICSCLGCNIGDIVEFNMPPKE